MTLQEKMVQVFELIPMDLLNKVEEIAMTNLLVLNNTNPMPLVICVLSPPRKLEQQWLKEKL
jgi:hypothetical protein